MSAPVAIVLPHREGFGAGSAGAVASVVRRMALNSARPVRVLGRALGPTFPGIAFEPVRPLRWLPLSHTQSYAASLIPVLRRLPPGPIEVHNKPDVALWLARAFPARPVSLFLHTERRPMRGARSPAARARLIARLAGIATVSDHLRRALLNRVTAPANNPVTIHNALDPAELPIPRPAHARDHVFLFAGRVVPDKAPDAFVTACASALAACPGWRAQIIGADGFSPHGPETGFIRDLRPRAQAAGVEMLGYQPPPDVLAAMARAAIVVVPSRWEEPFGLAALEAMACGAVLACSRRGGLAEVAGGTDVLFDPDQPANAAQGLIGLAHDLPRRAQISAASLDRARTEFGIEAAVSKLEAFRDECARRAEARIAAR